MSIRCWVSLFVIGLALAPVASAQVTVPDPVGHWAFDNSGDLGAATTGSDLVPSGSGFTAIAGVSGGDGAATVALGSTYAMSHGITPAAGDSGVSKYTLLFDFRAPTVGEWRCFFQTDSTNISDGDYFIRNGDSAIGVGDIGYSSANTVVANVWYRLLFTMDIDEVGNIGNYIGYLDGVEIRNDTGLFSSTYNRFSLQTTLLLFADNSAEDADIDVTNVAIYDEALTAEQATALGVAGDPLSIAGTPPTPTLAVPFYHEEGDSLSLTIPNPINEGLPIQWLKDGGALSNGARISGATARTLTITPLEIADSGAYSATYDDGTKAATSIGPVSISVVAVGALPVAGILSLVVALAIIALVGRAVIRRA